MSNASAAAAADERKSFVFQIDDASPSKEGKDAKDAENNKDQGLPLDGVTEEAKQRAIQTSYPYQLINEQDAKQLCEEFIDWPQSLPNGFAGHVRTRVKSPRSIATSRRNVRFMLGLLKLLGLDTGDFTLSLDMLAVPSVCKLLLQTLEQRKVGGQRRYQIASDLKHVLAWIWERAHVAQRLSLKEMAGVRIEAMEAYNMAQAVLKEAQTDKQIERRANHSLDEEDLVDNEKALSQEQRDKLQSKIEAFLSKPTPTNPGPTKNEAFRWQAHLLTYILNGNVIPVVRNEILCALKLGKNFVLDETLGVWVIDTGKPDGGFQETKTKTPIYIKFPRSETRLVCRWVDEFRPALLASAKRDHPYVFVTLEGKPRTNISPCIKAVQRELIGVAVSAHAFRRMQATESKRSSANGITSEQMDAMCAGRQHTPATASRYYEKTNRKRAAGVAEDHLTDLRSQSKKRRLAGKETQVTDKVKVKHEVSEDEMSDTPSSSSSSSRTTAAAASAPVTGNIAAFGVRVKKEIQVKEEVSVGPQRHSDSTRRIRVKTEDSEDDDVSMSRASTGSSARDAIVID